MMFRGLDDEEETVMRLLLCLGAFLLALLATPATAATTSGQSGRVDIAAVAQPHAFAFDSLVELAPFGVAAVAETTLAASVGTGTGQFRMTDDISAAAERQAETLRSSILTVWTMEVGGPIFATNADRAGLFD